MMNGRVIGGHYLNGAVTPAPVGSGLVLQAGLKWKRLSDDQVASWQEVDSASKNDALSAVGQAVSAAVLPKFISKGASAAVGAAIDAGMVSPKMVLVSWSDGKKSLIKLPQKLFTHFEMMLGDRKVENPVEETAVAPTPKVDNEQGPGWELTATERAYSLAKGMLDDHKSSRQAKTAKLEKQGLADQLVQLASLRDQGVLTEEEFSAKKAEILARM